MKEITTQKKIIFGRFGGALCAVTVMLCIVFPAHAQYESFFGRETWEYNVCHLNEDYTKEYDSNLVWWTCTTDTYTYRRSSFSILNGERYFVNDNQYGPRIFLKEDTLTGRLYARYPDKDKDFLLCDLSLSVGDTFFCEVTNNMDKIPMIVDSITYENSRKIIHLTVLLDYYYFFYACFGENPELLDYNVSLRFMEGIGPIYGIRLPNTVINEFDALLCVHKNDTLYYKTHEDLGCFQEHSGWNIPIHSQHMINVYPNPTHLFLTLEILSEDMGDGFVVIRDLMGHECFQMNIYDRVSVLPLASLSSGMYLLTFTNRRGNTFTKRIVIK